ncbi:MAG: hypothetical protein MUC97_18225 [Bernardetiaceae bacterium]|nr:hypothetical protein [Bernardetiaceae bacterium]
MKADFWGLAPRAATRGRKPARTFARGAGVLRGTPKVPVWLAGGRGVGPRPPANHTAPPVAPSAPLSQAPAPPSAPSHGSGYTCSPTA